MASLNFRFKAVLRNGEAMDRIVQDMSTLRETLEDQPWSVEAKEALDDLAEALCEIEIVKES